MTKMSDNLVTFMVNAEELQQFTKAFEEWRDLRSRLRGYATKEMDVSELYHLLAISGYDVMQDEIATFREILEGRS